MQGHYPIIAGVIEGQNDLIIIHKDRVEESFNQSLLAVNIGVVHICKLMQEEQNVFLFQSHILFYFGRCQGCLEFCLLLV